MMAMPRKTQPIRLWGFLAARRVPMAVNPTGRGDALPYGVRSLHANEAASCLAIAVTLALVAVSCAGPSPRASQTPSPPTYPKTSSNAHRHGIHKIQHVIVVMQENRSL